MLMNDPAKEEGTARGELRSFEELFNLYNGKVYSVCLRMTGNRGSGGFIAGSLRPGISQAGHVSW